MARNVTRGTFYVSLQNAAQFAINLLFLTALARVLTPSDIGSIAVLTFSFATFSRLSDLSLGVAAAKFVSEHVGRGETVKAASAAKTIKKVVAVTSIFCFAVSYFLSPWFSRMVWGTDQHAITMVTVFAAASVFVVKMAYLNCLRGLHSFGSYAVGLIVTIAFGRTVGLVLAWLGYGVLGVMIGWLAGELVALTLATVLMRGRLPETSESYSIKRLLRFSLPAQVETVVSNFNDWADQMIFLALTANTAWLGTYFLATRGAMTLSIVWMAFNVTVMPMLSGLYGRDGVEGLSRALKPVTRYLAYLLLPAGFGLAVISTPIMTLMFGAEYELGALPMALLAVFSIFQAFAYVLMGGLSALGVTHVFVKIVFATMLTDVGLALILIPKLGILGAALARVGMWLVNFVLMFHELNKRTEVGFDSEALWKGLLGSTVMAATVWVFDGLLSGNVQVAFLRVGLDMLFGVAIYGLTLLLLRALKPYDFDLLRQLVPSKLHWAVQAVEKLYNLS